MFRKNLPINEQKLFKNCKLLPPRATRKHSDPDPMALSFLIEDPWFVEESVPRVGEDDVLGLLVGLRDVDSRRAEVRCKHKEIEQRKSVIPTVLCTLLCAMYIHSYWSDHR